MSKLKDKVAIITGGGSGIGRAISELFAKEGAAVHILDLNAEVGQGVVTDIVAAGGSAKIHACNVSDQAEVAAIVSAIGKVDILVNNAGIAHVGNLEKCAEADFERVFQVNVKGAYNALHAVVPQMKQHGGGAILNLASIAAVVGIADRFAYSMSKGAIYAMSMSVARDYMKDNIRSNSISPARVHTPFVDGFISKNYPGQEAEMFEKLSQSQPIGRMAKPEEIAKLALFLCSDDAAFITGNDYPIDGGFIKLNN
ncbi:SDR family NAD(P)-dependent oxidoreductase [Sphingobacterium paludis]|jgi:2-keto-3-deoxy-L-fuconate dehydrogenase|uniref:NAD(P)-dependent dehydrogenase (Short-subunit alcohol dehydrogenase family) n=1 Tax=Sphingobacterium paludis TaxID=1476465 RepID=A0A4R7CUR1_9SPHI|nr:SDR family oxidoreductase [Sphingobacterium paludis]TDS07570.1 NAD(P)-dependent dehydrogenase (short-subunit alcohol dehydrogenase family) [Sphingobacterium paludis]